MPTPEAAMPGQDDHDRALSARGRTEAVAAGVWLREHGYLPDRVLCSSARRARETLDLAQDAIGHGETESASKRSTRRRRAS